MDEDNSEERDDRDRGRPAPRPGALGRPTGRHIRTPTTRGFIVWPSDVEPFPPAWWVETFEADDGTVPFERFAEDLPDGKYLALREAVVRVLAVRGLELAGTDGT